MSKHWKFCPGLKFKANFHPQMSVRRHELGMGLNPQPPASPTLKKERLNCPKTTTVATNVWEGKQAVYKHVTCRNDAVKMFRYWSSAC